jgi:hypothetical protein
MSILETLAKAGSGYLFDNYSYYNNHLDLNLIKKAVFDSGYLDAKLNNLVLSEQRTKDMFTSFLSLSSEERIADSAFAKAAIKEYTSDAFIEIHSGAIARGGVPCVFEAAKRNPNFIWMDFFKSLYASGSGRSYGYVYDGLRMALEESTKQDPNAVKTFTEKELFDNPCKPHHNWRSVFYREFIKTGSLTKKYARKIRSESSGSASHAGVKALIENKDLYTNYDDLLLGMSDSKYDYVLVLLAKELPIHLLTSIMGSQSREVLYAIERRMEAHEREQEAIKKAEKAKRLNTIIEGAPDLLGDLF